ncbi:MAG: hypothetical protein ACKPHU_36800, partial [Planctomycetaceae bacterium]
DDTSTSISVCGRSAGDGGEIAGPAGGGAVCGVPGSSVGGTVGADDAVAAVAVDMFRAPFE